MAGAGRKFDLATGIGIAIEVTNPNIIVSAKIVFLIWHQMDTKPITFKRFSSRKFD